MSTWDTWTPLPRAEVVKAIEREQPARIPLVQAKWWGEGLQEQYGERLREFDLYPDDAVILLIDHDAPMLKPTEEGAALDSACTLESWDRLDEFIAGMPDPETDPQMDVLVEEAEQIRAQDRYLLFGWWRLFFERPWKIRGMQNLLMDYYLAPEHVHRLHEALYAVYCGYIERAVRELHPDGFWTSDDLGHQTQLFMRPQMFREFIKPYYVRIGAVLKQHGLHWWLHSCGNNTAVLGDLAEVGVDVFHPVQKGTMDEVAVAREFGDRLTFLAGIDVQHTLQEKDPDGVRAEVRFLIDTFDRADGGMCIAAGNGIVAGTPFDNIAVFLDEAARYGTEHRQRFANRTPGS
jgi:uroporphyrinogen decarboxylase